MPELLAIPLVIVGLGILFAILYAGNHGGWAWVAVGAIIFGGIATAAVIVIRRPRQTVGGAAAPFEGAARPLDDGVHRTLLVIDDVCTAPELERLAGGGGAVFVVAPAVSSRLARLTGDEDAYRRAKDCLETTVHALAERGVEATGHVGSHDPLQAADEGLREFPANEIVFALHRESETAWLEQGVPGAARARYSVPVHELAARGPVDAER